MRGFFVVGLALFSMACGAQDPRFLSVLELSDTTDSVGPYRLEAYVDVPRGVDVFNVRVAESAAALQFGTIAMKRLETTPSNGAWYAELAGRPAGTEYKYYLELRDASGTTITSPARAPAVLHQFMISTPTGE